MLLFSIIFVLSLAFLIIGAEVFLKSAERLGIALGLSPFIVGVTIVAFGTSFPELFTAMVSAFKGVTEIIPANAFGSNIANILLVVGISAVVGKKLVVTKNLIDVDLPLLAISTAIMVGILIPFKGDGPASISVAESVILLITYGAYLAYTILHRDEEDLDNQKKEEVKERPKVRFADITMLILGGVILAISANYLVDSVIGISEIMGVGVGVVTILAVAIGTSLPELVVCAKAAMNNRPEVALGNVFGSNIFNIFVVIGLPGLFGEIVLDDPTFLIGLPFLVIATLLFVISGISKRIHSWEGLFFLALYIIFVIKLLGIA